MVRDFVLQTYITSLTPTSAITYDAYSLITKKSTTQELKLPSSFHAFICSFSFVLWRNTVAALTFSDISFQNFQDLLSKFQ